MSTQLRSDLKSIAPTSVSRSAMNPFGAKDLTVLAATLSPVGWAAREALIPTAPYRQSEFREDLAEYVCAALWATDNGAIAAGHLKAPERPLLAGAHRNLREPLTAMLRLNSDWSVRGTDMVAVRMIEQQRQALEVMADLTDFASQSAGRKLREASATPEPCAEEWSAEWSMISAVDRPEAPVAVGPAS